MTSLAPSLIDGARRIQGEIRQRPLVIDVGVGLFAAILGLSELFGGNTEVAREPDVLAGALIIAGAVALVLRRSAPILVLTVVIGLLIVIYIRDYDTFLSALGLPAIYSVTAHGERRRQAWVAVVIGVSSLFLVASFSVLDDAGTYSYADATGMLTFVSAAAVGGAVVRNRHEIFLDTEARADQAEADALVAAERAVTHERLRIAREMHDVVAHGMSLMSVQAAAAQETFEARPERTLELLRSIETTGRESLSEMRRMLGVLRNGDDDVHPPDLTPQPTLDDIEKLVAGCVDAGTPTDLVTAGDPVRLSPGIELSAFRIVQEALTNVLKHGGSATSAQVEIRYGPEHLNVTITDTGRGAASDLATRGSGNGLIGMQERVELYGGEFTAGPRPGGGYQVEAVLPIGLAASRPVVSSAEAETPDVAT